ncbi:hypothetical protein AAE478_005691 [Parahypoxylon ruwenzoriense]
MESQIPDQQDLALTLKQFTYDSALEANELRLLQPDGVHEGHLSFRLIHVARTEARLYTAISYTWGDENESEPILLNGQLFYIRPNLWSCLYHIGRAARNSSWRYLWVDAICINQDDIAERNSQVREMDQTYCRALYVSVWLGLGAQSHPSTTSAQAGQGNPFDWRDSIADLASHSYWTRKWTIQEFMLGRCIEVYPGDNRRVDWEVFHHEMYSRLSDRLRMISFNSFAAAPFLMARTDNLYPFTYHSLHVLIEKHCRTACKDPRDAVFALLGLVPHEERRLLIKFFPDYNIPEHHVRIIAVAHCRQNPKSRVWAYSREFFQGLGVEDDSEMARIWRRSEKFNYLDDRPSGQMLEVLRLHDQLEKHGVLFTEDWQDTSSEKGHSVLSRVTQFLLDIVGSSYPSP